MRHQIGDSGKIIKPIRVLCACGGIMPIGSVVTIRKRVSNQPGIPREVEVQCEDPHGMITIHKVKLSAIWFEGEEALYHMGVP